MLNLCLTQLILTVTSCDKFTLKCQVENQVMAASAAQMITSVRETRPSLREAVTPEASPRRVRWECVPGPLAFVWEQFLRIMSPTESLEEKKIQKHNILRNSFFLLWIKNCVVTLALRMQLLWEMFHCFWENVNSFYIYGFTNRP